MTDTRLISFNAGDSDALVFEKLNQLSGQVTGLLDAGGGGGGGASPWVLAGTGQTATGLYDAAVDGAKANVDFVGLAGATDIMVLCRLVTLANSGIPLLRLSVDNGASYFATAGDYANVSTTGAESATPTGRIFHDTNATAARSGAVRVHAADVAGVPKLLETVNIGDTTQRAQLFVASLNDIDAVRIIPSAGGNITGGKIYCFTR